MELIIERPEGSRSHVLTFTDPFYDAAGAVRGAVNVLVGEDIQRRAIPPLVCLTRAYNRGIIVCMRTTLNIDDSLLAQAGEYTGETEKTALVRMGLEALIQRESARRLAALGGTMPSLTVPPRRRPETKRRK